MESNIGTVDVWFDDQMVVPSATGVKIPLVSPKVAVQELALAWDFQPRALYTVIVYDMGSGRGLSMTPDYSKYPYGHMIVTNIPNNEFYRGDVLLPYENILIAPGETHDLHVDVFAQDKRIRPSPHSVRSRLDIHKFVDRHNLRTIARAEFQVGGVEGIGSHRDRKDSMVVPHVNKLRKSTSMNGIRRDIPSVSSPSVEPATLPPLNQSLNHSVSSPLVGLAALPSVSSPIIKPITTSFQPAALPSVSLSPKHSIQPILSPSASLSASPSVKPIVRPPAQTVFKPIIQTPAQTEQIEFAYVPTGTSYFKFGSTLTEQEEKYCRCVLHVASKQPGECNLERAWFQERDSKTCANPWAICASRVHTTTRKCGENYDFGNIPDNELRAYANLNKIEIPGPYYRNLMLRNIETWKRSKGKY